MKYFIDTHDRTKGSFPATDVNQEQMLALYNGFDAALQNEGGLPLGLHVNLAAGKVFCLTAAEAEENVFSAHQVIKLPYDSITQVQRVSGMDMREAAPVGAGATRMG